MSAKDLIHLALVAVIALACGIAFATLYSVFKALSTPPPALETEPPQYRRVRQTTQSVFDSEAYHSTIIENNLFRPLGWTPPRPVEPYRLIGTILPRSAHTAPQAIIETTAGKKTYILTTGEKIDASTEVVEIHPKSVVLETDGQQRTLRLSIRF